MTVRSCQEGEARAIRPGPVRPVGKEVWRSSRLAEIGIAGDRAVGVLRSRAGWSAKRLLRVEPELLDLDATPQAMKRLILNDVERIARLLLIQRFCTRRIGRMILAARRLRGEPVRVLDVGAGRGALLLRLHDWAASRRVAVELYGVDRDPAAVAGARRAVRETGRRIDLRAGDARALPFESGSMDVVVTTLMLHHLPPGDAARVLHEIDRVAAVNLFAFDLRRDPAALAALWAFLRLGFFAAPTRHDSLLSLRKGYGADEVQELCRAAASDRLVVEKLPPAFFVVSRA